MQFIPEVQEEFRKAGWFPGRNVKKECDALPYFHKFPPFFQEFFYEYGGLVLKVASTNEYDVTATWDFSILFKWQDFFNERVGYYSFPIADYDLDNATLQGDSEGNIYLTGDFETLMANDFKTGIEKAIMDDYTDALVWDKEIEKWVDIKTWHASWGL
jgi:hypothetical protein